MEKAVGLTASRFPKTSAQRSADRRAVRSNSAFSVAVNGRTGARQRVPRMLGG